MRKFTLCSIFFSTLPFMALSQEKPKPQEPEKKPKTELVWQHDSIMYDKNQIDWVRKAIKSYVDGIPISILLPDIFSADGSKETKIKKPNEILSVIGIIEAPLPITPPVFRLDSILYLSSSNSSVWLNGKKVSLGQTIDMEVGKIKIAKITENKVAMVWTENKIQRIFPKWKTHFKPLAGTRFASNDKNIVVDLDNEDISFILGVNQWLNTASMEVMEGEIANNMALGNNKNVGESNSSQGKVLTNDQPSDTGKLLIPQNNSGYSLQPDLKSLENYTEQLKVLQKSITNN